MSTLLFLCCAFLAQLCPPNTLISLSLSLSLSRYIYWNIFYFLKLFKFQSDPKKKTIYIYIYIYSLQFYILNTSFRNLGSCLIQFYIDFILIWGQKRVDRRPHRATAMVLADGNAASTKLLSVRHWPWEALKSSRKADVSKRLTPSVGWRLHEMTRLELEDRFKLTALIKYLLATHASWNNLLPTLHRIQRDSHKKRIP